VTSLSVGTPYQTTNNVCLDTSLTMNSVVSLNCAECAKGGPWFNGTDSSSIVSAFNGTRTMIYNVDEFDGNMYNDRMCLDILDPTTCLANQTFFEIDSSEDPYALGGFIGLGPIPT